MVPSRSPASCNFAHELTTAPSREQVPPHGCWNLRPYARRIRMQTSEARALVTEIQDRLIDLYM
jgi:hypothetical protein